MLKTTSKVVIILPILPFCTDKKKKEEEEEKEEEKEEGGRGEREREEEEAPRGVIFCQSSHG